MWKNFKVIDADGHMHEPQYLWERYVEPKYRDQVPKVSFMDGNFRVDQPDGRFVSKGEIQSAPPESARRPMSSAKTRFARSPNISPKRSASGTSASSPSAPSRPSPRKTRRKKPASVSPVPISSATASCWPRKREWSLAATRWSIGRANQSCPTNRPLKKPPPLHTRRVPYHTNAMIFNGGHGSF